MNLKRLYIPVLAFTTFLESVGTCQTLKRSREIKVQPTAGAICEDVKAQSGKPSVIRGPYLISPDGLHKAYATVEVQGPDSSDQDVNACRNHSTLFVANGNNGRFDAVLDVPGKDDPTRGNGLQLVDWSPDSATLLADLLTWHYGSEGWEHNLVLYSSKSGIVKQKSLSAVFQNVRHMGCIFDGQVVGFLTDGRIAVREYANTKDEVEEFTFCGVEHEQYWAFNFYDFRVSKISGSSALKYNSRFEEQK
jgi:hypothetical protein